jgi:hypothetical protein
MSDSDRETGSDTYHIPKLTDNYRSWLTWILYENELLNLVEGRKKALVPLESGGSISVQGKTIPSEEYTTRLAKWNKKAKKV